MVNNCYGCENRYVGCHSECEIYKSFRKHLNDLKRVENKNKTKERIVVEDAIARKHHRYK